MPPTEDTPATPTQQVSIRNYFARTGNMVRGRLNAVMSINESDDNDMDTSENRKRQRSEAISDDEDANPMSDSMLTQTSMLGSPVTGQLEAIREQTMRVAGGGANAHSKGFFF